MVSASSFFGELGELSATKETDNVSLPQNGHAHLSLAILSCTKQSDIFDRIICS